MATGRPEITYPVRWTYKVIGEDEERLRAAIGIVVGDAEYAVSRSHTSSQGRYVSVTAEVMVASEDERNRLFGDLGRHADVRVVI